MHTYTNIRTHMHTQIRAYMQVLLGEGEGLGEGGIAVLFSKSSVQNTFGSADTSPKGVVRGRGRVRGRKRVRGSGRAMVRVRGMVRGGEGFWLGAMVGERPWLRFRV